MGKNLAISTFPSSLMLYFSRRDCQGANASSVYVIFPFIFSSYLCTCSWQHTCTPGSSDNFQLRFKALICFITVGLNHLRTKKNLSKCKDFTVESKIQSICPVICYLIRQPHLSPPLQQARASAFRVIILNSFCSSYHKNDALKILSFKAIIYK